MASSIFKNNAFLRLWLAQILSQTAQNGIFYALMVFIEQRTSSTMHMSFLILSTILPSVVFGIASGILVDRVQKKLVLVISNALRGVIVAGYILFDQTFALIYLVNLIFSTVSQFFGPAEAASIPMLVKRNQLITANGLFNLTFTASQLAGFVLVAPPLVKIFGAQVFFVIVIAVYMVSAILVGTIPADTPQRTLKGLSKKELYDGVREEVDEGWRLLKGDTAITLSMIHLTLASTLMLITGMLAPGFVSRVLGIGAEDAVYVLAPAGVGIVAGTAILPRLASRYTKLPLINGGLLVMSFSLVILGIVKQGGDFLALQLMPALLREVSSPHVSTMVTAVMFIAFILGLSFAFVIIPAQTLLQERAPVHMRGKVFAVQLMLGSVASVVPLIFIGSMADILGVNIVIMFLSLVVFGTATYSIHQSRRISLNLGGVEIDGAG